MPFCSGEDFGKRRLPMEPSFEKLLARLVDAAVEFIVVGGVAVTLHGYARLTEDVDILIRHTPENVSRLLECLSNYGEGFARELNPDDFTDEEGAIRVVEETERAQIDIFTRLSGLRFEDLSLDASSFVFAERTVSYASKQALIRLKEGSHRDKDRMDASALRQLIDNPRAFD